MVLRLKAQLLSLGGSVINYPPWIAILAVLAAEVEKVDKLGKILTAAVAVGAVALLAAWIYFEQIADSVVRMGLKARVAPS